MFFPPFFWVLGRGKKFDENLAGGSAIPELQRALEEYLSLIVGLTKKGFTPFFSVSLEHTFVNIYVCKVYNFCDQQKMVS